MHRTNTLQATLARAVSKKEICNVAANRQKLWFLKLTVQEKKHFFIPYY